MKRSLLFLSLLMITHINFSQTSVEALKKELSKTKSENQKLKDENKFLNEKLDLCTVLSNDTVTKIKSFSSLYTVKLISCKGDRNSQTVKIELLLNQSSTNKNLTIDYSRSTSIDALGVNHQFLMNNGYYEFYKVFTDVGIRITMIVKNILPGTDSFSLLSINMATSEMDITPNSFDYTEIRNLKIIW